MVHIYLVIALARDLIQYKNDVLINTSITRKLWNSTEFLLIFLYSLSTKTI